MRVIASLAITGLMIAASLGGCASPNFSINIPSSVTLFSSEPEPVNSSAAPVQTAQQQSQSQKSGASTKAQDARNAKKGQSPKGQPSKGQAPAAATNQQPATTAETSAEKESTGSILGNVFSSSASEASAEIRGTPVEAYSMLAQQIHACWLKPGAPILPNHGLHAEVTPNDPDTAKIIIYEKAPDNKRGLQVFRIIINGGSGGSTITSENRRLDTKLDNAFKVDLSRWAKGDTSCR